MSFSQLTWGVKASFRGYVEAAGGSITLDDGAARADDGAFVFAAEPGGDLVIAPDGSATGAMRFKGTVTFDAHGGMLKSKLTELGIEATEEGALRPMAMLSLKEACLRFLERDEEHAAVVQQMQELAPLDSSVIAGLLFKS